MSALMTGSQKAALLLIQLGKDQAARVMSLMEESEIEELTAEIARLERIDAKTAGDVIDEFYNVSMGPRGLVGRGGLGFAQQLLEASMGRERAAGMLERLATSLQGQPFEFMMHADARQIVGLLSGEHPQTIALVMAHLRPDQASQIMTGLPPDVQAEVAHRIALMDRASPDVVAVVAENLQRKASAVLTPTETAAVGGVQPLVEIINRADPTTEKAILEGLEQRDKDLADEVRSRMFVFSDVTLLEDRAIQLVLRGVEMSSLATALKGASDEVRDKILSNLSERARDNLVEEMDLLGPVRMSVVEEARAAVVQAIRQLEETGQIVIRREGEDEYVA
ncbi:flagellar motor switch protein FliG [Actinotalea sp. M2MS4P-6]|uniref:flagellar motor switch protein FliG n=1 Tax=Actinotalea sp. M2MS4P-6 TaxID=2983762 RepID=UPI0021E4533F|nr:flagellar motor switch protein FliG [Actinotalea sp. M2MS4P-6]MCV2392789.1 flagellar motor switch protein FliG [Actinotalea sp. M2MS4P-6]